MVLKITPIRGTWGAQSVKHPNLDFSSGLDLKVMSSSSTLGSVLGMEPTLKKKKYKSPLMEYLLFVKHRARQLTYIISFASYNNLMRYIKTILKEKTQLKYSSRCLLFGI